MEKRFDIKSAIDKYQRLLQRLYLITNSFPEIKKRSPFNEKKRWIQLAIIINFIVLNVRYIFVSLFLLLDVQRMHYYQYMTFDYMEQLSILGRTINVIYAVALIPLNMDKTLLRMFENQGSLEFLTGLTVLKARKASGGLTIDEKKKLAATINWQIYICKLGILVIVTALHVLQVAGCILFVMKISQSWTVSMAAVIYCSYIVTVENISVGHIFAACLMTHITTSYFVLRVKSLTVEIQGLMNHFSEQTLSKVMDHYDSLIFDLKKHNQCLRIFIRNMIYGYSPLASIVIYIMTVDTNIWFRLLVACGASFFTLMVIITEVFVGHLEGRIQKVYKELNNIIPRVAFMSRRREVTFDTLLRVKMAVRELGSERKDGQFTVGLTNGEGASFKSWDAFQLTLTTLQFTILIIKGI